jgi:hypothetical protein
MNAVMERFVGSARREMLDHILLLGDRHFDSLARQYNVYFNEGRPHQGIEQRVPSGTHHHDVSKSIMVTPACVWFGPRDVDPHRPLPGYAPPIARLVPVEISILAGKSKPIRDPCVRRASALSFGSRAILREQK